MNAWYSGSCFYVHVITGGSGSSDSEIPFGSESMDSPKNIFSFVGFSEAAPSRCALPGSGC